MKVPPTSTLFASFSGYSKCVCKPKPQNKNFSDVSPVPEIKSDKFVKNRVSSL